MERVKKVWNVIGDYVIGCICVLIGLTIVLQLWHADLKKYPLQYGMGDDMTAAMTIKTMQETGWMYRNPLLGAPSEEGATFYDSSTGDLLLNVMERVILAAAGDWVLTLNLFYLAGYFLCMGTALSVMKRLNIRRPAAIMGSVLYAFLPYHFFRGLGHLFLSEYFMVPLMVYYIVKLMGGETVWRITRGKDQKKGIPAILNRNNVLHLLLFVLMALTGVYYSYFFCYFLCISMLYKILNREKLKTCLQELLTIIVTVVSLIASLLPSVIYWRQHGSNSAAIERNEVASEIYSLKLTQLILPITGHRIEKLATLRGYYDEYALTNENMKASLGAVMTLGFLVLLFSIFIIHKLPARTIVHRLMILTYAALLIGTIGSFSSIIGYLFSMIRCYNRISVFIAMFSVLMVCILADRIYDRFLKPKKFGVWLGIGCVTVLMVFGIWDQTSVGMIPAYDWIRSEYDSDEAFVAEIEAQNENGMIFQMPYVVYPEQGPILNMIDYSHLRGYLHSDSLRWSYCAVKGREIDSWQKEISELPVEQQIKELKASGFTGIYIDTAAYTEEELKELQDRLRQVVGEEHLTSPNGRMLYYGI